MIYGKKGKSRQLRKAEAAATTEGMKRHRLFNPSYTTLTQQMDILNQDQGNSSTGSQEKGHLRQRREGQRLKKIERVRRHRQLCTYSEGRTKNDAEKGGMCCRCRHGTEKRLGQSQSQGCTSKSLIRDQSAGTISTYFFTTETFWSKRSHRPAGRLYRIT